MKKSRRIVKKMSKKSLINKKALRYIIANSNLCKHAIRELELAGYSKEEDGPNKMDARTGNRSCRAVLFSW